MKHKDINSWMLRCLYVIAFLGYAKVRALGQCEQVNGHVKMSSDVDVNCLQMEYGTDKQMPENIKGPILLALSHYPELRKTRIRFRIRHALSPLTTNRDWGYYFRHLGLGRRAFVVTISDRTTTRLTPILFNHLDFAAQTGVIGHELAHVSDFRHKNLFGWLRLGLGHLSARYVDRLEFGTDSLCIAHGLGYNLLAWSCFVRRALEVQAWQGAASGKLPFNGRERYMNPSTILAFIITHHGKISPVGKAGSQARKRKGSQRIY